MSESTNLSRTALVVAVPQAERLVGNLRSQYDPSAAEGMPAHVTVLYPFRAMETVTPTLLSDVKTVLSEFTEFSFLLSSVGRFPATAFLRPEPSEPFVRMTDALVARFPDCVPYGGQFASVIPHLTVVDGDSEIAGQVGDALNSVISQQPVRCVCATIDLYQRDENRWRRMHRIPLKPESVATET